MSRVVSVKTAPPYILVLAFDDGRMGRIDMQHELCGEVFEPLHDYALFSQAAVDPDFGSVYWPTGADLSPEFLEEAVTPARTS